MIGNFTKSKLTHNKEYMKTYHPLPFSSEFLVTQVASSTVLGTHTWASCWLHSNSQGLKGFF